MIAHIGDRVILDGIHLGDVRRVGVITGTSHADGGPPYQVRWLSDGRTTLIFPGPDARIEPASRTDSEAGAVMS